MADNIYANLRAKLKEEGGFPKPYLFKAECPINILLPYYVILKIS